jgi:hypothetical protein
MPPTLSFQVVWDCSLHVGALRLYTIRSVSDCPVFNIFNENLRLNSLIFIGYRYIRVSVHTGSRPIAVYLCPRTLQK